MKTKFKYLTLMATAFIFGLSSCSNDDEPGGLEGEGTPKSLFLKISGSSPATYAEGSAQKADPVTFSKGLLYFTDGGGVIKARYTIGAEETDSINIAELTTTGKAITNLPGDVSAVYIVGNTLEDLLPTTNKISDIKEAVLNVETQGTITDVSLYGEALSLTSPQDPEAPDAHYTCTVKLAPIVARFELTDIKATGVITGFEVAGIFIDNYYSKATVNGSVSTDNLKTNGANATAFSDNSAAYPDSLKTFIYDWYTDLNADNNIVTPPTGADVWGYNVFASATGSTVPRIVIRLKNVTAKGITYTDDQFITIKGFKKEGGASLEAIKAGEVYSIAGGLLSFDETDISGTPNLSTIDVEVTVTLASWVPVDVTPEL